MKLFSVVSLLIVFSFLVTLLYSVSAQNDPTYQLFWDKLHNNSRDNQQYIKEVIPLPWVYANPSIIPWIWDDDPLHQKVLISWCGGSYACLYIVTTMGPEVSNWTLVKPRDNFEIFDAHGGKNRQPFLVGDIRLYVINDTIRITYCTSIRKGLQHYNYAQLFYDKTLDALYVLRPPNEVNIEHEVGGISQKSWSPFIYDFNKPHDYAHLNNGVVPGGGMENLFVYSVNPHRIVHGNESISQGVVKFHTITSSEAKRLDGGNIWDYGEARSGTPSLLIDTIYGPRYVTICHSQAMASVPQIKTYFMCGYIFKTEPPFEITHFTDLPIVPKELYDEKNGWAYKALDYIVFSTGMIIRDGLMYITLGRNDRSGYVVVMNTTEFVASLKPVRTKTTVNRFFQHISYSKMQKNDKSGGDVGEVSGANAEKWRSLRGKN